MQSTYRWAGLLGCTLGLLAPFLSPGASAAPPTNGPVAVWLRQSKVTGQFRTYYYTKRYSHLLPFRHTFSTGGWLNVHTPGVQGFSADVGVYTAQALGLNAHANYLRTNILTLPAGNITTLGQAYLQYRRAGWRIRAGNQIIKTPFAGPTDFRMIPGAFQGVDVRYGSGAGPLSFEALRMFRYKPWYSSDFTRLDAGNNPPTYFLPTNLPAVSTTGFLAAGAKARLGPSKARLWYYKFYRRLNLVYGDYEYHLPLHAGIAHAMSISVQGAREWNASNQVAPYQRINSTLYGAQLGFFLPHNIVFLGYDGTPVRQGDFRGGAFVAPYTQGAVDTNTVYTDILGGSFGTSLLPGHAFAVTDVAPLPSHHLKVIAKFVTARLASPVQGAAGPIHPAPRFMNTGMLIVHYYFKPGWDLEGQLDRFKTDTRVGMITYARVMLRYTF